MSVSPDINFIGQGIRGGAHNGVVRVSGRDGGVGGGRGGGGGGQ